MAGKEYIEREAARDLMYHKQNALTEYDLDSIPAADVAPVVHAEWEFRNDGRYGQTRCYCSACGKHSGIGGIRENQMKPFCPNCGAKMEGERK